jgi:hypothetical protein
MAMGLLLRLSFLIGFCLATLGAAGFASPREPEAVVFLAVGLALVATVGIMQRSRRLHTEAVVSGGITRAGLATELDALLNSAQELSGAADRLEGQVLVARLEALAVSWSAIGVRNEEYQRLLGLKDYVRVWDGFATGERLLARAWSMAADGYVEEARLELPKACAHLERAAAGAHA